MPYSPLDKRETTIALTAMLIMLVMSQNGSAIALCNWPHFLGLLGSFQYS